MSDLFSQNKKYLIPIVEHELLHVVYKHILRKEDRNRYIWNIAADMAVNSNIDGIKGVTWAHNGLTCKPALAEQYNLPERKTAEWYYDALIKEMPKAKAESYAFDDHSKWIKSNNKAIFKEVIKRAVETAYNQAKKMGTINGNLEEIIKDLIKPAPVNWRDLLRQYVACSIKAGYKHTWKRANRRFPYLENIKGKTSDRIIKILISIDSSGSISTQDFKDFLAVIKSLLNVYRCYIDYIVCDTKITAKGKILPWSKLDIKFKGRGGTDYKPTFKYFNKHSHDLLIFFTDLYCDYKDCNTNKDIIWVTTKEYNRDNKPPFGKMVEIK